jgi:Asp-tRNA(Asn)/Glu-tRNA(Gln) amidotransferase A subunit family amidase
MSLVGPTRGTTVTAEGARFGQRAEPLKSAVELRGLLESKQVSAREVVAASLERMREVEPSLNGFVCATSEIALEAALQADRSRKRGCAGSLDGIPISVKDLLDVAGVETTFGSRAMVGNVAREDAPAVQRVRQAGGCIVGKTTTTEFGCKAGGGDSPLTGITRNPWNLMKSPGGSSAGAAASVAAAVTPFALGTDGGGSVRVPAALCGLVGFKPQFGRVPVFPPSAAPSLFHVGILSRTVADAALLLSAIAGYDTRDPCSIPAGPDDYSAACEQGISGLRVAWSPTLGYARPSPEVLSISEKGVRALEEHGARVETLETVVSSDPEHVWNSEFYAGAGYRLRRFLAESPEILDPAVVDALQGALSRQTMEDYVESTIRRLELREKFRLLLEPYDVLITPTLPVADLDAGCNVPPGHEDRNVVTWSYYTYPVNLTGNPAVSVPCGSATNGMPVGIQVIARLHREVDLFRVAGALERARPWPTYAPFAV